MADYWQPTADGYFGRVSKEQTLDAVTEGAGKQAADDIAALKKADLAKPAERSWRVKAGFPRSCARPASGGRLAPASTPGASFAPDRLAGSGNRAGVVRRGCSYRGRSILTCRRVTMPQPADILAE